MHSVTFSFDDGGVPAVVMLVVGVALFILKVYFTSKKQRKKQEEGRSGTAKNMLDVIGRYFPLYEQPCGEYQEMKFSGMKFHTRRFYASGFGPVAMMSGSLCFGLMKAEILIINPTERDMPLLSYNRVCGAENDRMIFELYDTMVVRPDLSPLSAVKRYASSLPDYDLGCRWCDAIRLPQSLAKQGNNVQESSFDSISNHYLTQYIEIAATAHSCEAVTKRKKTSACVEGMLRSDSYSTNLIRQNIGEEKTAQLFRKILFATEE